MFSVIIQNQKTLNSFDEYSILFATPEARKNVGICKWVEEGQTIEKALPGILELTDDKEEWRAVIVLSEYEDVSGLKCNPLNPFDFGDIDLENSPALVRLTHMLGGVPRPEVEFTTEVVKTPGQEDRVVYKPVKNPEKEAVYNSLQEKYFYNGKKPSEIIIVATRKNELKDDDELKDVFIAKFEQHSSEFWKTNAYPSGCRFVLFDLHDNGKTQYETDFFNFWVSIWILTANVVNASSLQAYRVYNMESVFDKTKMQKYFQKCAYRIEGASHYINETRKQLERERLEQKRELPSFYESIPVTLHMPPKKAIKVEEKEFDMIPASISSDMNNWNAKEREIRFKIKDTLKVVERELDETADRMRQSCKYPKSLVYYLSDYQKEDMNNRLDVLQEEIIDLQSILPLRNSSFNKETKECSNEIERKIRRRIDKDQFRIVIAIVCALILCAAIPAFALNRNGSWMNTITVVLGCLVIMGTTALGVMLYQKHVFDKVLERFNNLVEQHIGGIVGNSDIYSSYMSAIASHCKGASFLSQMECKEGCFRDEEIQIAYLDKLGEIKQKIEKWCQCNYLDVSIDSGYYETVIVDDNSISPEMLAISTILLDVKHFTMINDTGERLISPFDFIGEFKLEREEFYDGI